ncbi:spondin domain-containing protein [Sphingobacterium siyangense]|uniref:spondin domain-containing protein n=1 Tax=Sphingobacterium siyangense TaxID=459529 RepID=UPI003015AB1F
MPSTSATTITIENVLDSKPLVESGSFKNTGASPVVMPGEAISIKFSAAKGQALSFATMYGWSNDLFFAPANPGIKLYQDNGTPVEGDVSAQIKLWDNGTRINQMPGAAVIHPGTTETLVKSEIVREEYKNNVSALDVGDSKGRTQTKIEARTKTLAVMKAVEYKPYERVDILMKMWIFIID